MIAGFLRICHDRHRGSMTILACCSGSPSAVEGGRDAD